MVENGNGNGENVAQSQAQAQPLDVGVGRLQFFFTQGVTHTMCAKGGKSGWGRTDYVMRKGVRQDAQKQALLLHTAGLEVQDILILHAGWGWWKQDLWSNSDIIKWLFYTKAECSIWKTLV